MVKMVCYNIEYCEGIQGKWWQYFNLYRALISPPKGLDQRIINELKKLKLDIIGLIEIDLGSKRNKKKDEVDIFGKELQLSSFVEAVKYHVQGIFRWTKLIPILKKQGIAILSKFDLEEVKYHMLKKGVKRVVIQATIHCPKKVTLLLTHLSLGGKARRHQLKELKEIVNNIQGPIIMMGDFNTFKGDTEIRELLEKTKLTDAHELSGDSMVLTQPAWHPKRRLDYILTTEEIKVKKYKVLNFPFSDHLPLFVDFTVK